MLFENFKELGLSENQIKVYKAVLNLGISSISEIQEKTGLERRSIYDILSKLIDKGFLSYIIEDGKKTFKCSHPNKIKEEITNRKKKLTNLEKDLQKVEELFNLSKPKISALVYRGDEGIKTIFNEMLEYDKSYIMGGNSFENYSNISKGLVLWFSQWMLKRVKKKHIMHDLVSYGTKLKDLKPENIEKHKKNYYKYCELPKGIYTPLVIGIFGNKVVQIIWNEQPFAFVLESEKVKDSFMEYFNYFWKNPW